VLLGTRKGEIIMIRNQPTNRIKKPISILLALTFFNFID
jgi:hypothetical protein